MTGPTGTYPISRDAPIGTILAPWTSMQGSTAAWVCSVNANVSHGAAYTVAQTTGGIVDPIGEPAGTSFVYFNTSLPGVGLIVRATNTLPSGTTPSIRLTGSYTQGYVWSISAASGGHRFGYSLQFAYVKTGPISAGTASPLSGTLLRAGMDTRPSTGPSQPVDISLTGSARFMLKACQTPDVSVAMGRHLSSAFDGVGSTTPAIALNIRLNSCPTAMKGIRYRIDPVTAVIDPVQSVVALDSSSSARGIGVQLLNGSGTAAFPLQSWQTFHGYVQMYGGDYTIPLKARYYQASTIVGPGTANTSMTFTMQYL